MDQSVSSRPPADPALARLLPDPALLELLPCAAYVCDADGRIVRYNRKAVDIWGRAPAIGDQLERYCGSHRLILPGGAVLSKDRTPMADALRTGRSHRGLEIEVEQPDGARLWAQVHIDPIRDDAGRVVGAVNCFLDVTARRRADEALRDSEARLGLATATAGIGVWDWDLATNRFVYSPQARAICGFGADEEITFDHVSRIVHRDDYPITSAQSRRAMDPAIRDASAYEYRIVRPDGAERWVLAYGEAIFAPGEDGAMRAVRYLGTLQDITDRRRLEDAERTAAQRLRLAMEAGRMAAWEYDIDTDRVTGSPELNRLLGFAEHAAPTAAEMRARQHPEDRDRMQALVDRAVARGERFLEFEYRHIQPDGELRWLSQRAEILPAAGGRPRRMIGVLADITARRRTEDALRQSEDRAAASEAQLRALAGNLPSAVFYQVEAVGADGRHFAFVSANAEQICGVPAATIQADPSALYALIAPEHREAVAEAERTALQSLGTFDVEFALRRPDGEARWCRAVSAPRRLPDARLVYDGLLLDITDAKQTEEKLRAGEERLRLAFDAAELGEWEWSSATDVVVLSPRAAQIFGLPAGAPVTWSAMQALLHEDDVGPTAAAVTRAAETGGVYAAHYRIRRADDGAEAWVAAHGRAYAQPDGGGRIVGVVSDITARRTVEERERLLSREIDHRARNALSVVQSLVRMTPFTGRDAFVATIVGRVDAMARVHTLLSKGRWAGASVRDIVEQELAPYAADRVRIEGGPAHLRLEAAQPFSLLVHELATNAAKHGALAAPGGRLDVDWAAEDGALTVRWRETGAAAAAPSRIGFGTRLIDGAVAQLGAAIARSWGDSGLTVTVQLQGAQMRSEEAASSPPPPAALPRGVRNAAVLVVEDESLLAMEMKAVLERAGARGVGPAHTLDAALALARTAPIDCAVLDANLNGASIAPVAAALQQRGVPFLIVTGYQDPGVPGAPVLHKPVSHDQLLCAVGELLAG